MLQSYLDTNKNIFGEKLDNVEYMDRRGVYGVVLNKNGKIATIKTSGGYFLPGGGIENIENHKECLEREFMEETGYEIEVEKYIGQSALYHISRSGQYIYGIGNFYFVSLKNKTCSEIEKDHEMLWMEPNECIKSLFLEHQVWAIAKAFNT